MEQAYIFSKYFLQIVHNKFKKVHRVLQFNQSNWLGKYIDLNTNKRREAQQAGNKCLEALFKLMNNAFFGKEILILK